MRTYFQTKRRPSQLARLLGRLVGTPTRVRWPTTLASSPVTSSRFHAFGLENRVASDVLHIETVAGLQGESSLGVDGSRVAA